MPTEVIDGMEVDLIDLSADNDVGADSLTAMGKPGDGSQIDSDAANKDTTMTEETIKLGQRKPFTRDQIPKKTVLLRDLSEPALCQSHPERSEEILQLYLRRTTFQAEVWVNYNSPTPRSEYRNNEWILRFSDGHQFYHNEPRNPSCGRLQLRRDGALERIRSLDPRKFEMMNVDLIIGTYFRHLYVLSLSVRDRGIHIKPLRAAQNDGTHEMLDSFVLQCCLELEELGIRYGRTGMTVQDLETYASLFVSTPDNWIHGRSNDEDSETEFV